MSELQLLAPLARSFVASGSIGGPAGRVLEAIGAGERLGRQDYESLLGEPGPDSSGILADFLLYCIRAFVSDHTLTTAEKGAVAYLRRLTRLDGGQLVELRQVAVGELLALELARLLEDRTIDAAEAVHQVDLQEVLGLGYDQYLELTRPQIHGVALALAQEVPIDPDGIPTATGMEWYHRQLAGLDTVFALHGGEPLEGPDPGYLYVLVNPSMGGLVKIGKTTRAPRLRAQELGAVTGVPTPFLLVFDVAVLDCTKAERYVHDRLEARGARVAGNREFFRIPPPEAITLLQEAKVVAAAA